MDELRLPARLYVAALTMAATAAVAVALGAGAPPAGERLVLAGAVAVTTALAYLFPVPFGAKAKTQLDTAAVLAAALLLAPGLAALAVALGAVAAQLRRRVTLAEVAVNGAQTALQGLAAGAVLGASGWDAAAPRFDRPGALLALLVALGAAHAVNLAAVAAAVAFQTAQPLPAVLRQFALAFDRGDYALLVGQALLAALAAAVLARHAWLLLLLLPTAAALHAALAHRARGRRRVEARRLAHSAAGTGD
jgi:hypothetical protein